MKIFVFGFLWLMGFIVILAGIHGATRPTPEREEEE